MSLNDKFVPIRTAFYEIVSNFFKKIAGFFGYPTNLGMPTVPEIPDDVYARLEFIENLPRHKSHWPPSPRPETWFEMIFGTIPKVDPVPRYIYENAQEGFYNFYIENYKNIYFLPDWLSQFLQIKLHFCLDLTLLEMIREALFVSIFVYFQIVAIRINISWFIYINPYTIPWCYIVGLVDWIDESFQGLVPAIFGVNITGSILLGILGVIADSLNHLVFTMPFLPSEGEKSKLLINGQIKDILVFHYLPNLWYRHPIPNELREFWYEKRPDILDYMQKAYKNLEIQFLPDKVAPEVANLSEMNPQKLVSITQNNYFNDSLSTLFLSKENLLLQDFKFLGFASVDEFVENQNAFHCNLLNDNFHNFVVDSINKFV